MQSKNSSDVNVNSAFPTLQQTADNYDLIYSDHLPIYTTIPINANHNDDLRALSYNVMGARAENNLTRTLEDEDKSIARYGRIAHGLKNCADNLGLDLILLQEVSSTLMIKQLSEALGDDWCIQPGDVENEKFPAQQLTCYRKSRLLPVPNLEIKQNNKFTQYEDAAWDARKKTLFSTFKCLASGKRINLCNVWSEYNIFPNATEEYYKTLLMNKKENEVSIILGDTNSRIAPVDDKQRNLTTGIVPYMFNNNYQIKPDIQIPDHPDGGFYSSDEKIHQLVHVPVNIINGQEITDKHLKSIEQSIPQYYRAILCIDDSYAKRQFVQGQSIFDYESELKKKLNDKNISVRITATIQNKKGIQIRFSPKSACFNVLHDVLKDDKQFSFESFESLRGLIPCIFLPAEGADKLARIIELYHLTQTEREALDALINGSANIPKVLLQNIEHILESFDNLQQPTERDFENFIVSLRSCEVLIKTSPSFYNHGFVKGIIDYAVHGGRTDEVSVFMDFLKNQIETWIDNPPKNPEYARNIVESIKSNYFFKKYERLEPLKGKLAYMQALIHQHGLMGIEKNIKQAIASFNEAGLFGNKEAFAKLGDMKLKEASLGDSDEVVAENPEYIAALQYYEKAGKEGYRGFSKAIFSNYKQSLRNGNFIEASNCLAYLQHLIIHNPEASLVISGKKLDQEQLNLDTLQKSMIDAIKVEAHYLKCQSLGIDKIEQDYLSIKNQIEDKEHPVFYYYYFLVLSMKSRLMKSSQDEDQKKLIVEKMNELTIKLLNPKSYSSSQQGALDYVYGLALNEQIPGFKKGLEKGVSAKEFFTSAINKSCPLGYSYLANIMEMEQDAETTYLYYLRGSLAGDPRCQISFFHRFLQQKLKEVSKSEDIASDISVIQDMLTILHLALNNEYLVASNRPHIESYIQLVENVLAERTYKTKELFSAFWSDKTDILLANLKKNIELYEKSDPKINEATLLKLYEISDDIVAILSNKENKSEENAKLLRKMYKDINTTISFFETVFNQERLNYYMNSKSPERIAQGFDYFKQSGHMDSAYYLEHIDPYHRMNSMIKKEWNDSVFSNYPFVKFLQKYKNTDDIPQVLYLNEYQKQGILVKKNEMGNIAYQKNGKVLPDGKFLFVLDKKGALYLADEKNSFNLGNNKTFQHTSFLSGGHVQCAGEICIKDGKIININNGSGHYVPTVRQLFQAIAALKHLELIDVDHPEFRIGVFGVRGIPDFSGNLLQLTTDEFLKHFDALFEVESEKRNLQAFSALINNSNMPKNDIDPYENKECASIEIIYAMTFYRQAEHLLNQYKNEILKTPWNPGFFSQNVVVNGKKYCLPQEKYNELKMIDDAADSNNWVGCIEKFKLVKDTMVLSLLRAPEQHDEQPKNDSWFSWS